MPTPKLKIISADVQFLSLCPAGKNLMKVLYKEDGTNQLAVETLVKDDRFEEEGVLTAIVYAPGMVDAEGHFADRVAVASMQKSFGKNGSKVDIRHNGKALTPEQAYVFENFLTKADDPEFSGMKDRLGRPINTDGAWVVRTQIDDENLRREYREGKWNGVSLFGPAVVEAVKEDDDAATRFLSVLTERLTPQTEEIDMNAEELKKALQKNNESLVTSLTEGLGAVLEKALKPKADAEGDDDPKPEPKKKTVAKSTDKSEGNGPEFEGDRSNPADVAKHVTKLKKHKLEQGVDWNDPESVERYQTELAKMDESEEGEPAPARSSSPAPARTTQTSTLTKEQRLQKEIDDSADLMAAFVNGEPTPESRKTA